MWKLRESDKLTNSFTKYGERNFECRFHFPSSRRWSNDAQMSCNFPPHFPCFPFAHLLPLPSWESHIASWQDIVALFTFFHLFLPHFKAVLCKINIKNKNIYIKNWRNDAARLNNILHQISCNFYLNAFPSGAHVVCVIYSKGLRGILRKSYHCYKKQADYSALL